MTGFPEPDMDKDNCQVMEYGRNKNRREETQIIYKQHKPHRENIVCCFQADTGTATAGNPAAYGMERAEYPWFKYCGVCNAAEGTRYRLSFRYHNNRSLPEVCF